MDEAFCQARVAALREKMEAIHSANRLYWIRTGHSHEADMEHQQRQERLEQIRKEIQELKA